MTLRHFSIYVKVCEKMNMTAAARELYISQSAVSQAIAELESHYSVRLFERYANKLYITEAGRLLLTHARHMLDYDGQIEQSMAEGRRRAHIDVGATLTVGPYFLPPAVAKFRLRAPDTDISIHTHNTRDIENLLLTAELDIAVVEGAVQSKDITVQPLAEDEMVFVCGADTRLIDVRDGEELPLDAALLQSLPFLMRERGSGSRWQTEEQLREHGINYHIAGVFNSIEGIKRAAACDLGIGVVSRRAIAPNEELKTFTVSGMRFYRTFSLVYHKSKHFSAELEDFIAFLRTCGEETQA